MTEPISPKHGATAPVSEISRFRQEGRRSPGLEQQVVVRFYRRMAWQRVYPLSVEPRHAAPDRPTIKAPAGVLHLRPFVPGAHVVPAEAPLNPGEAGARALFYVTPLARGRLRDAQLGIYHQGRLVQQMPLPMKGVSQRLTWLLLALTFLVPGLLWYSTKHMNLTTAGVAPYAHPARLSASVKKAAGDKADLEPPALKPANKGGDKSRAGDHRTAEKAGDKSKRSTRAGRPAEADRPTADADEAAPAVVAGAGQMQGRVERFIRKNLPDVPGVTDNVAAYSQQAYDYLYVLSGSDPLCFYTAATLLVLTLLSWILHRGIRGRRLSKPFSVTTAETPPGVGVSPT